MTGSVYFVVPGEPQGKGRARVGKVGDEVRMFTPAKTVAYEGLIAMAAQQAMQGAEPFAGPCRLYVTAICSIPKSFSKAKREEALGRKLRPAKKPDADNIIKACADGMNGVVWVDDVQAVDVSLGKFYGEKPCLMVLVEELS